MPEDSDESLANNIVTAAEDEFHFKRIEEEEVLRILRCLDTSKAVGMDMVSAKLLKIAAEGISRSLTSPFNFSLDSGQIPLKWKAANVTPVPKGGDSELIENFHAVSVLPVVVKVFERLMHQQLFSYLLEKNIGIAFCTVGFQTRAHHSGFNCTVIVESWRNALDGDLLVGSVMVDLSKAFDIVDHDILLRKLSRYGVREGELRWFEDYLRERKQKVCIGDEFSAWSEIKKGVPQGSILGPLLFTLYVNDLPQMVKRGEVRQYTDDTTLSLACKNARDLEEGLTRNVEDVVRWERKTYVKKTQMFLLSKRSRRRELVSVKVKLKGQPLTRCGKVKCLGVWNEDCLTWMDHIADVRRALSKIRRLRDVLPVDTKTKLCNTFVLLHLHYCCVLWHV